MRKYYIATYGCQMNKSDSERIAVVLENTGYKSASNIEEADLVVVNMCSVRQSAVDRIFGFAQKFGNLKSENPNLKTILTGCILKKDRKKLSKEFDFIIDTKDIVKIPGIINYHPHKMSDRTFHETNDYFKIEPKFLESIAYIPIMTGCDNFCAYCVVPYVRGREISRTPEKIINEVKDAVKSGVREIWLLGQNVNNYKFQIQNHKSQINSKSQNSKSKTIDFPKLLKMVNDIPGDFWIRFTSPHPKNFSDELIDAMKKGEKVAKYLNLPVQSGDNEILKKMNRNYTVEDYKKLVDKIRKAIPDINLSTDVIVGFPGETKRQFENTDKLFKEIKFNMAYISKYSPRRGTAAFKMKDNVSIKEKKRREKILREIIKQNA